MKTIFLFFFSFFLFTNFSASQKNNQQGFKRFLISASLGNVPLPGEPMSFLPGAEVYITERLSLYNEVALQLEKNEDFDSAAINKKYFRYKAELRYYLTADKRKLKPYIGGQFATSSRRFDVDKTDRYYDTFQQDSVYSYSSASISSPVKTFTVQFGLAIKTFRNFYLDLGMGIGTRVINTTYTNVVDLQTINNTGFFNINPVSSYRYNGKLNRTQLNLAFRISYRF
jgi:hypothetical protein